MHNIQICNIGFASRNELTQKTDTRDNKHIALGYIKKNERCIFNDLASNRL